MYIFEEVKSQIGKKKVYYLELNAGILQFKPMPVNNWVNSSLAAPVYSDKVCG